ncbi:ECF transporter S component [Acetivibrio cellulolyticus]|uniref:ECF transporter S component n=1 Tax=Acetivibrio cellulolyticus TaxID=35830 RepID=UPI0001E2DEF4|nr:ECF transporter S component [Acetivibrio cellulolyticus]
MNSITGREYSRKRIRNIILDGLMIAMVFLVTYFTKIPGPVGPFNIGDAAIIVAAILLGKNSGFIAGAFGSALADIAFGALYFAPITFLVKGLEGFIIGFIVYKFSSNGVIREEIVRIVAIAIGCLIMIAGYFLGETFILSTRFGFAAAMLELPFNAIQAGLSALAGYLVSTSLVRVKVLKRILE